jgi:outer membrane receptor for ferrienterochelin and colicins
LGVKNILNSFQNDFDLGIDRDPAYIYGPTMPRTIYFGVKIGNAINF